MSGFMLGALLIAGGLLTVACATQLAAFNATLVASMSRPLRTFYQNVAAMGHPYESDFWIGYNRIGGGVVAACGICLIVAALLHR